jgi:hypothetical protein
MIQQRIPFWVVRNISSLEGLEFVDRNIFFFSDRDVAMKFARDIDDQTNLDVDPEDHIFVVGPMYQGDDLITASDLITEIIR